MTLNLTFGEMKMLGSTWPNAVQKISFRLKLTHYFARMTLGAYV